jgi:hypothetical protein
MLVDFNTLSDNSRIWIFQSALPLDVDSGTQLIQSVHWFINDWTAHQQSLTASAEIRDDFFLVVAVDEAAAGASGCSVDKLFRFVQDFERENGIRLTERNQVVVYGERATALPLDAVIEQVTSGLISSDAAIYDVTVESLGDYRSRFVAPVGQTWLSRYLV